MVRIMARAEIANTMFILSNDDCESTLPKEKKELLSAVQGGTLAQVQELLEAYPNNLSSDEEAYDYLLLVTALKRGHKSLSNLLIKKGCKVKIPTKTGKFSTPLYYAVEIGDLNIFRELFKRGALLYDTDADEISALEFAILEYNKSALIAWLLKTQLSDSDKLKPSCSRDIALFHAACWTDNVKAIDKFISHGFSLGSRSTFKEKEWMGFTPLHFALKNFALSAIDFLLKQDVDFHDQDEQGRTSLHLAFQLARELSLSKYHRHRNKPDSVLNVFKAYVAKGRKNFRNTTDLTNLSHFHIVSSINFEDADNFKNQLLYLKYLIDKGIDVDHSVSPKALYFPGYTALHFAAYNSCFKVLKLLLENNADHSKGEKSGCTPLHTMAQNFSSFKNERDLEVLKLLVEHGADVHSKDLKNSTPLHDAFCAQLKNEPLIQLLLTKIHPKRNIINNEGLSYFHIACTGADFDVVRKFVENGAEVGSCIEKTEGGYSGYSALHFAVSFNRVETVNFLLTHGATTYSCTEKCNTTPLHLACSEEYSRFWQTGNESREDWMQSRANQIRIIELLLEYGACVNTKSRVGSRSLSPLATACELPNSLMYKSPDKLTDYQKRVLGEITTRQEKIMGFLLHRGAHINTRHCYGGSLLHLFARQHKICPLSKDFAENLLKRSANVNIPGGDGLTPLNLVVSEGLDPSLVDLFIDYGADINKPTKYKKHTPLHNAVVEYSSLHPFRKTAFIKLLEHPRVNLNARDYVKETALHIAMNQGKNFCVQKLLDFGADINVKNQSGDSPIHYCLWRLQRELDSPSAELIERATMAVTHVKKLEELGLFVSEKVRKCSKTLFRSHDIYDPAIDVNIEAEIELLKSSKINYSTSLYDILLKHPNDVAKHVKNEQLEKIIESPQATTKFPLYQNFLIAQYKKGCTRRLALNRAKDAFRSLSNVNFPELCIEHILNYLDNENLDSLTKSGMTKDSPRGSRHDSCKREKRGKDKHPRPEGKKR